MDINEWRRLRPGYLIHPTGSPEEIYQIVEGLDKEGIDAETKEEGTDRDYLCVYLGTESDRGCETDLEEGAAP